ncbi:LysR family transcriptional regulator [Mesorhizobium sp. INR15]|uniref:LysR family transcriptional regulator n=1 Tax=Mesorhizobium sp. INR15 TaxID=2654248 RepID=UPI00189662E8|nr:LysR family transcriptional regulator [Mesorhizobium sp. INR15]QPC95495.1 LysR family transcriptional regulator [Mesorhizobium sp. INR15]
MDIRFLESFVEVVDCGSIADAARYLNLTPAAVAQRLKAIERELGHSLVSRAGRTVRPTESGLAVLARARQLIAGARDLRAIAANDQPVGALRLGSTATGLTGLLPAVIASLSQRCPRIEFFVRPGSSLDLYHSVMSGETDAAVVVQPPFHIPKSMGWVTLREEALVLIVPEAMEAGTPESIIGSAPFIRYDRNQWGGQIVERYLRKHRLKVREWLELDALDSIAALVSRGLGVAIVPDWSPPWPEGLRLRKIVLGDGEPRKVGVVWSLASPRIAAIRAFVETCGEACR